MANSKISDLTTGSAPVATDELVVARSGANYKLTYAQLVTVPVGTQLKLPVGSIAAPSIAAAAGGAAGIYFRTSGAMTFVADGTNSLADLSASTIRLSAGVVLGWASADSAATGIDTQFIRSAANVLKLTQGSSAIPASLLSCIKVTANTATATPAVTDSGTLYSNTGDSDGSTITLPNDPTIGTVIEAFANVNQAITITPAAGESIQDGAINGTTSTVSSTQGAWIRLVAVTGGSGAIWGVCGKLGTWVTT